MNNSVLARDLFERQDPETLVARYQDGPTDALRESIMVAYSPLVERVARKFSGIETIDDLIQVGYIGLLNALKKFDRSAGVRFNTYATYLVAGEIKHYLRDRAQTIRHPAWLQELRHKVNRATNILTQEIGHAPSVREIADNLGVSESAVVEVIQTQDMLKIASLDAPLPGEDDGSESERLDAADYCPGQLSFEDRLVLEHALMQLRDLERSVLIFFHFDSLNQTEIAEKLGISCNYVSHILRQALAKLRKIVVAEDSKDRLLRREAQQIDWDIMDDATGCYSESFFRNRLEEEVHRAISTDNSVSLVIVEFTGLEQVHRFYGSQSVIDFLADASEFFRANVRRLDIVARYGQTGFAVILPSTGSTSELVRQRLIKKTAKWTSGRFGPTGSVGVEIGYANAPEEARNGTQLIAAVRLAPLTGGAAVAA